MKDFAIINNIIFPVKIAISIEEQAQGLMDCKIPTIMAFPGGRSIKNFWMKNTPMPLDLIFACNGAIVDKLKGVPFSLESISSPHESDLVVEFPRGVLDHFPINIGDSIDLKYSIKTIARKFDYNLFKKGML
jgi:hypothetical protein